MSGGTASEKPGSFLVLEGLDGAGTTTQGHLLVERLRASDEKAQLTGEPSEGPVGALLRQILRRRIDWGDAGTGERLSTDALALLFAADRLDHLRREILPLLSSGAHVVCDRYFLSSYAYQMSADRANLDWLRGINSRARRPDLTIYLKTPATVSARRREARREEELLEAGEFQRRVEANYDHVVRVLSEEAEPIETVDGDRPVEAVAADIWTRISARIPRLAT
ncbi:MAG: dTMP kinase [Planctomycetes bacterium]|nr:dTMP kinase [Planctomycetota bacterium]